MILERIEMITWGEERREKERPTRQLYTQDLERLEHLEYLEHLRGERSQSGSHNEHFLIKKGLFREESKTIALVKSEEPQFAKTKIL